MKITTRCGSATVEAFNEALIAKAVEQHLVKTKRVRADTTVVEADVRYPTDSGLLTKAIGKAAGQVERIKNSGAAQRTTVVDHVDASRRHAQTRSGRGCAAGPAKPEMKCWRSPAGSRTWPRRQ